MKRTDVLAAMWRFLDKPERWQALADIRHKLSQEQFLSTFVKVWVESEGNNLHVDLIDALIDEYEINADRIMPALSSSDHRFFAGLPDRVAVYRGTSMEHPYGNYSWTTDREKALWFANRIPKGVPALASGVVLKSDILFVYNGRGEHEVAVKTCHVYDKVLEVAGEERDNPLSAIFFAVQQGSILEDTRYIFWARDLLKSGMSRDDALQKLLSDIDELEDFGFVTAARARRKIVNSLDWDSIESSMGVAMK